MTAHDSIDLDKLRALGIAAEVEHFESLESTQDRAIERIRGGVTPLPLLVVAEEQTAGRGRGANRWWTGRGSLAFSLVFDPAAWNLASEPAPIRSLAAGVAVVDTIAPRLSGHRVGLHWPNDVFVGNRKVAGILVDVLGGRHHVVGIGLNVNNPLAEAPEDVRLRAASLCDLADRTFDRTAILAELLVNLRSTMWSAGDAGEAFGQRLNEMCLQSGCELVVDSAGRRISGICTGIAADGALLLDTPAGFEKVFSGVLVRAG